MFFGIFANMKISKSCDIMITLDSLRKGVL